MADSHKIFASVNSASHQLFQPDNGQFTCLKNSQILLPGAIQTRVLAGNTKEGSITVPLTSCLTGWD
jgi:hypothetical protein